MLISLCSALISRPLEGDLYKTLTALIGHLRRQVNLISNMKSTCPKVSGVCWISVDSVSTQPSRLCAEALGCKETILRSYRRLVDLPLCNAGFR
jgi:hypothetical protein